VEKIIDDDDEGCHSDEEEATGPQSGLLSPQGAAMLKGERTLKPTQSLCVHIKFMRDAEDEAPKEGDVHEYDGILQLLYNNGSVQDYDLHGSITYPACELSTQYIDFGIVRIGADLTHEIVFTASTAAATTWALTSSESNLGDPPRRGSVSMGRRASVTGVAFRRSSLTQDMIAAQHDPFGITVCSAYYEAECEFRFYKKGGEMVSRRKKVMVGGWLGSLTTAEVHEFYDLAAGKNLIPKAPWGIQILNWVYQFATEETIDGVKESMEGMDTFNCIFLGVDLAEWFELRKEAKSAGQLDGKSLFLKDDESQAKLKIGFTPHADCNYHKKYDIRIEHGRRYSFVVVGQGTSDEEMVA